MMNEYNDKETAIFDSPADKDSLTTTYINDRTTEINKLHGTWLSTVG
jgi:hypothetical protein